MPILSVYWNEMQLCFHTEEADVDSYQTNGFVMSIIFSGGVEISLRYPAHRHRDERAILNSTNRNAFKHVEGVWWGVHSTGRRGNLFCALHDIHRCTRLRSDSYLGNTGGFPIATSTDSEIVPKAGEFNHLETQTYGMNGQNHWNCMIICN